MAIQTRTRLLATTLFAGVAAFTPAAMAQTTSQAGATQETTNDGTPLTNDNSQGDIIVTGTLIRNPNIVASSPVAVVTESELQLRNIVNAEQAIRDVPGAVAGTGSQVNNGNGGFATANLRGLGSQRNLILLDGDRMVTANQQGTVDLNNIPLALVQRTDVLTGGASTTYGADAVSGVINFITRSDFAGVDASASQRITERGDANLFRADVSIGANFDDGRGNAVFSVGYQEADALYQGSRDVSVFTIGGNNGVAAGASPTSVPTRLTFSDGSDRQINPNGTALQNFYSGFNFAPYNIFVTPFKRYNMYGAAKYDVSDTVEVYTRGIFSKNVVSTIIAPSGIFGEALTVPGNNPYLPAAVRDEICTKAGIALGATCNNNAALPITVFRRTVEIGPRISEYTTQFFDYKAGLRLNISGSTKLDVSGAYGESTLDQVQSGYVLRSRVQQALNANNTTTCQVTTNNCVPLNLFGPAGSITADQAAFLNGSSTIAIKNALSQAKAVLTGNFDSFSPVSTNPVGYAIGAEYRKYTYVRRPDSLAISPGELGGAGGAILPFAGGYEVKEAYGEIIAPLIADAPFFHSLTIEGGVRYSDYKVDAATSPSFNATTWKAGGSWEPIQAIKFRGNYQRAVRAPNIAELFAPFGDRPRQPGDRPVRWRCATQQRQPAPGLP
jgi:outer membrane receptor protein involved in Fe transport